MSLNSAGAEPPGRLPVSANGGGEAATPPDTSIAAKLQALLERCRGLVPVRTAVVHPCDAESLSAALEATRLGLIDPVIVAPRARLQAMAAGAGLDIGRWPIIDTAHSHDSAAQAVALVRAGKAEVLMKGSLHSDELLTEVIHPATGLRTARRVSHCFVMDVPGYPRLLIITDAAVNIAPTLAEKVDIVQNAIDLAATLGFDPVRVAVLSAMETVNPAVPSTIEAAALCKMADRGQIVGALVDGPLAMDNAISLDAVRIKHIESTVAGRANVLLVPDLEAGNMLAKSLSFLSRAEAAGVVMGARVPVVLPSRADSLASRLAGCAVAALLAHARRAAAAQAIR